MWNIIAVATSFHSNYIPHDHLLCYYLFLLNKQTNKQKPNLKRFLASVEKNKSLYCINVGLSKNKIAIQTFRKGILSTLCPFSLHKIS